MAKPGTNALTAAIVKYLNFHGFKAWRNNTAGVYSVKAQAFRRNPATLKGIPDVIGFYTGPDKPFGTRQGCFIGVEVKGTAKDKLSPAQSLFLRNLSDAGGIAICARSFDQFLTDFHALTGTKQPKPFSNGLKLKDPSASSYT